MIKRLLRKLWMRRKYAHLEYRAMLLNYKSSDLRRTLEKLAVITPADFATLKDARVLDLSFRGVHGDVGAFIIGLKAVLASLELDVAMDVNADWVYKSPGPIPIGKWLTRSGDYYIDPVGALTELLPLLKELLQRKLAEPVINPKSFRTYNERVLHHVYLSVQDLVDTLALMHMRCLST